MSEKEMRVNGVVATTRGLGNHGDVVLKKSVIVEPHTMSVAVDQYCQFLLLASHGVWEVFSETEATNLLLKVHVTILSLSHLYITLKWTIFLDLLGHLSHSGDLLLWVGVRRRPSCVVH